MESPLHPRVSVHGFTPASHTPSKTKSWFLLRVSGYYFHTSSSTSWTEKGVLCTVDLQNSLADDVARLEKMVFDAFSVSQSTHELRYITLYKSGQDLSFQATLEQLVEHLRELDVAPSSSAAEPDLYGFGGNAFRVYFRCQGSDGQMAMDTRAHRWSEPVSVPVVSTRCD